MNPTDQELVDRLRRDGVQTWHGPEKVFHADPLSQEAAARLSSLSQANERMARALEPFARLSDIHEGEPHEMVFRQYGGTTCVTITVAELRAARSALSDLSAPPGKLGCYDCHRPYSDGGFPDLIIPDDAWAQISPKPDGEGVLCPSCICKRLADKGIKCDGKFTSGPLAPPGDSKPVDLALFNRVLNQFECDLKSAHAEICKLQGLDPATHRWPDWSPQANSLRWIKELRAHPPADSIEKAIGELAQLEPKRRLILTGPFDDGTYRVEIYLNGTHIGARTFDIDPLSALRAAMERIEK